MSICVTYGVTKQMIFGVVWSSFLSSNNHVNGFVVSGDKPGRFGWPEIAIGDANWWMGSRCRCHMCVKMSAGFPSCPLFWCFFRSISPISGLGHHTPHLSWHLSWQRAEVITQAMHALKGRDYGRHSMRQALLELRPQFVEEGPRKSLDAMTEWMISNVED